MQAQAFFDFHFARRELVQQRRHAIHMGRELGLRGRGQALQELVAQPVECRRDALRNSSGNGLRAAVHLRGLRVQDSFQAPMKLVHGVVTGGFQLRGQFLGAVSHQFHRSERFASLRHFLIE